MGWSLGVGWINDSMTKIKSSHSPDLEPLILLSNLVLCDVVICGEMQSI
jgi:hypothetical protein